MIMAGGLSVWDPLRTGALIGNVPVWNSGKNCQIQN